MWMLPYLYSPLCLQKSHYIPPFISHRNDFILMILRDQTKPHLIKHTCFQCVSVCFSHDDTVRALSPEAVSWEWPADEEQLDFWNEIFICVNLRQDTRWSLLSLAKQKRSSARPRTPTPYTNKQTVGLLYSYLHFITLDPSLAYSGVIYLFIYFSILRCIVSSGGSDSAPVL